MTEREKTIEFHMNYCQHYDPQPGKPRVGCKAGMDIDNIQSVETPSCDGNRKVKWGPCIGGHTLPDPTAHCPSWLRITREDGEKRADEMEKAMVMWGVVMPAVNAWRNKPPKGKQEIIECPACKGRLHLSQAASNGHVHAHCETDDCISWME